MANLSPESTLKDFKSSGKEQALALRLVGKFKTAFPGGKPVEKKEDDKKEGEKKPEEKKPDDALKESKSETSVILVGDADMIHDNFTIQDMQTPFGNMRRQLNGNLNFAQNAVEQLAGDNNLIAVRSRATLNRPFTLVRKMEAQAEERFRGKAKELQDSLAETQARMNELQQNKDKGQRFILSPEQQAELEKFRKKEAQVRADLKKVQKDLRREIDLLEGRVKWMNIFAVPLAVTLGGLLLAGYKRKLTAAK